MHAALTPVLELSARSVSAWGELSHRALEPNPFFEPEFAVPLARFARDGYRRTLHAITVEHGGQMMLCLPLYVIYGGPHRRSWCAPHVSGLPLLDGELAASSLGCALGLLRKQRGIRRLLRLDRVPIDGSVADVMREVLDPRTAWWGPATPSASPLLRRRPEPTYLKATLTGKRRTDLERRRRRLEETLGDSLALVDLGGADATIGRFLALEGAGWKARAGTAIVCDPAQARFFSEMCRGFLENGRLRVLALEAAGTPVAMKCNVISGPGLFPLKTAYDERFGRFSPGVLLEVDAVEDFHQTELSYMESCTNHETNPLWWLYPDRRRLGTVEFNLDNPLARLPLRALRSARHLVRLRGRVATRSAGGPA